MAEPAWLQFAKTVPAGQKLRIQCCAEDRSMLVSNTRHGYTGYCFRCKEHHFVSHGEFSLSELDRRAAEFALVQNKSVELPNDFSLDIPQQEALWLLKAGISFEVAKYYGIGWSARLGRIIVPTYENGKLVAYTARLQHGRPKYIEKSVDPTGCVFVSSPELLLPSYKEWAVAKGPAVVFVEDNLSAIRVGRVAKRVVSLMGTSANTVQLDKAFSLRRGPTWDTVGTVVVWLDPDKAGLTAQRTLCEKLQLFGVEVRSVLSERDPKYYSNAAIQQYLIHSLEGQT